ncbi:MAG TPA: type II secretion system major pseudopilin GspG, partial [Myxococcota bacterium]|nr:type II secretion system major pseudopilin GspG [Myxococcota bacterium]
MEFIASKVKKLKKLMRGFSLIEIMVVVTLMAILIGIGTVYFVGQLEEGKINTARAQAYEIAKAIELYKLRMGNYPTPTEGLQVLVSPPRGSSLLEKLPLDPWKREYHYAYPGTHNPKSFDVWSDGPDGTGGPENEIGNWQPEESH